MSKAQGQSNNPLLGRNIPPPPVEKKAEEQKGIPVEEQKGIPGKEEAVLPLLSSFEEKEKATIELSLYLRPSQDEKLEDLRRAYKRRIGKKISANELMRRLIDRATLETIL